ncbi:hypothetical protein M9H77_34756 [Catharanthus roseus]|uniref:Uncharacterized protein n=1 Tax=Catharanthus roseus TaxID=4058 RepID=A0ACB9ZNA8_CATRO|nr:hypothetical protein M9H77_34756 [Catharanthus roseus]
MVRITATKITENIIKILLREGFIENVRKYLENNKDFLVLTLRHRRNRKRPYQNLLRISGMGIRALPGMEEQKWIHEGLITESLPNGMFRVCSDNEDLILGYVSGKIRRSFIRIIPGDRRTSTVKRTLPPRPTTSVLSFLFPSVPSLLPPLYSSHLCPTAVLHLSAASTPLNYDLSSTSRCNFAATTLCSVTIRDHLSISHCNNHTMIPSSSSQFSPLHYTTANLLFSPPSVHPLLGFSQSNSNYRNKDTIAPPHFHLHIVVVAIHLDRASLARILGIPDEGHLVFYERASTSIFADSNWVYSKALPRVGVQSQAIGKRIVTTLLKGTNTEPRFPNKTNDLRMIDVYIMDKMKSRSPFSRSSLVIIFLRDVACSLMFDRVNCEKPPPH